MNDIQKIYWESTRGKDNENLGIKRKTGSSEHSE